MTWVDEMSALAEKARAARKRGPGFWLADVRFQEACSPERVRALCEIAKAAQVYRATQLTAPLSMDWTIAGTHLDRALAAVEALDA